MPGEIIPAASCILQDSLQHVSLGLLLVVAHEMGRGDDPVNTNRPAADQVLGLLDR
jgi:hypothetical protein